MKQLERLVAMFDALLNELGTELQNSYQVYLGKQFKDPDGKILNDSDTLRSSRGGKSLKADLSKNSKVNVVNGKVELTFETDKPYAGIQNRGGFIKAKPALDRFGNKTYKMAQYFWYLHAKEEVGRRKLIYRSIALGVQKRGCIRIKPKHYLEKSLKEFESEGFKIVMQKFFKQVIQIWNG